MAALVESSTDTDELLLDVELVSEARSNVETTGRVERRFRPIHWGYRFTRAVFCITSMVGVLAVLVAIPVLQLVVFGYLLEISGRLTKGMTLRESVPNLRRFGKLGLICLGIFLASLPTITLVHWESVAQVIDPDSNKATLLRVTAIASCALSLIYLMWAWARGGKVRHYLWPQPVRFFREGWRWSTWKALPDQLWDATAAFEILGLFWLGLRGFVGTLVWLIPAGVMILVSRDGRTGLAGLIGAIAMLALGAVMLYLPMLQANFAADNRLRSLYDVRKIRRDFKSAPWAWALAMLLGLVVLTIPLYLLKIEATPEEVVWLPCILFVAFGVPARVFWGLALRRARHREPGTSRWALFSRISGRVIVVTAIVIYLAFLFVSAQYVSWDGLRAWIQQHAVLIPIPFLDPT